MNYALNRKLLQSANYVLVLIPLLTGLISMMGVHDPLYATLNLKPAPVLDSNMRFFGGAWLGLGLALLWLTPRIEQQTTLYRALWGMIFIGGIGRLLSIALVGWPPAPFVAATILEIAGAPLFVAWQHRLAQAALLAKQSR